jgi:predicted nucleic acid-binding protein
VPVSDSSPLLYLAALGDLNLLPRLFGEVYVPQAVWQEVVIDGHGKSGAAEVAEARGDWLTVRAVSSRDLVLGAVGWRLELGETEAIVLASELDERVIFMDDERAVREGRSRGFIVVRTPAIYIAAKQQGWIERIRPKLDLLRAQGFRLRESHYRMILADSNEV